jgi:hypothetical protein
MGHRRLSNTRRVGVRTELRSGTARAQPEQVNRKVALIVAAVVLPGGLIALVSAWFLKALSQTERGRKVVARARKRLPTWKHPFTTPAFGRRQAA